MGHGVGVDEGGPVAVTRPSAGLESRRCGSRSLPEGSGRAGYRSGGRAYSSRGCSGAERPCPVVCYRGLSLSTHRMGSSGACSGD